MLKLLIHNNLIAFIMISALSSLAMAVPSGVTFKIKISKPDGSALEEPLVDFRISTLDSAGTCVLYSETFGGVSMTGTGGSLIFDLGSGAQVYSAGSSFAEIFNNLTASYTCQAGGTTTPIATSGRKLVLQFNDGTGVGWQTINPVDVKSVPYALHANNAEKLAGHPASDFLQGSTNLSSITSTSTARTNLGAGVTGSSIFTAATASDARTTLGLGTSATLNVGTAATNLVQLDGTAKIPAALLPSTATFWQDAGSGKINYNGGWVGLGTANPYGMLHLDTTDAQNQIFIINNASTVARNPSLVLYNLDGAGLGGFPKVSMRAGRGSVGAQVASQPGDIMGMLEFQANRGGVLTTPATMTAVVTEIQTSAARGGALAFSTNANGTSTLSERMRIDHSGNVGIGTTTPTKLLEISGTANTPLALTRTTNTTNLAVGLTMNELDSASAAVTVGAIFGAMTVNTAGAVNGYLHLDTTTAGTLTEKVRIDSSGNVGIGTTAPAAKLNLDAAGTFVGPTILVRNTAGGASTFPGVDIYKYGGVGLPRIRMFNGTGTSAAPTATASGNILGEIDFMGYGDTAAIYTAKINAVATAAFTDASTPTALAFSTTPVGAAAPLERLRIKEDGTVGIGIVSPTQALDVVGNIKSSGCIYYASSFTGTCASDERIKKDVHSFDLGLKELLGINPVFFKYNGLAGFQDDGKEQLGVIAQQVEKAAPGLIKRQLAQMHEDDKEKTEIKVVDYGAFTYVIINSIKEFYAKWSEDSVQKDLQIKKLTEENEAIKNRLDQIEKALSK